RLAALHSTYDGYTSAVVTPAQIYNEFSSGNQDISAIRDFVKMFYDRAASADELPQYLLFLGDASYDYKNRISENTNFVPTFQSPRAVNYADSYATDDFFGFLDSLEGPYVNSLLDIGIGRFPVKSAAEAGYIVDKIAEYLKISNPLNSGNGCDGYTLGSSGEWKNIICFVADDEQSDFFTDCENFATYIDTTYNNYNIEKIYCDAYVQETGAGGQRYPDVNDAINRRIEKGALIINYIGHGGEVGWAHERILQIADIESWENFHNLPLFITATCEFSRYDDPKRTSAGEMVLLKSDGGGIALLTTSRLAYSNFNAGLNGRFYQNAFKKINGSYPALGDLVIVSKNWNDNVDPNVRNFILLGDPALSLSYPENKVLTTKVNQHDTMSVTDTLKALQKVIIEGIIADPAGQKLTGFNGVVYPIVYDKKSTTYTLGNDSPGNILPFMIQKSILYKGKVSVTNGDFTFSFVVPMDIAYNYGKGRISYYASDGTTDANGFYENNYFIIGGTDTTAAFDNAGPEIRLYLNDSDFVSGGMTSENPLLLSIVKDTNGINTVGNGIGHDIVAVLDGNTSNSIVLNDYYEADLNSYQKGTIRYPLEELSDGIHTLSLKVWDIYNNSSETSIDFFVSQSAELALYHVLNYPNPFTTHTEFYFEHNQPCCDLDVQIQIFTITGKLVKTIDQNVLTDGFRAEPIAWDGLDEYGDPIARGVYLYRLKIKNTDGSLAEKTEKLVILR
ncbi:MAG: type IX secretion system sortase PorU, partial [Bacteroidota bacterium]